MRALSETVVTALKIEHQRRIAVIYRNLPTLFSQGQLSHRLSNPSLLKV